jgi:hypothetical protein
MLAGLDAAAPVGPERAEVGDDALPELVAGSCECECDVGVQALERARAAGATDAELEGGAAVATRLATCERTPEDPLLLVCARSTLGERRILLR